MSTTNQRQTTSHKVARRGFTLVELVVVILILGILAGVAAPKLLNNTEEANKNAFITQLYIFVDGFTLYAAQKGGFPAGESPGVLPSGVENFISAKGFARPTPFGGQWDYLAGAQGQNPSVGAEFPTTDWPGDAVFQQLDNEIDDGDTSTGALIVTKASRNWVYFRIDPP